MQDPSDILGLILYYIKVQKLTLEEEEYTIKYRIQQK